MKVTRVLATVGLAVSVTCASAAESRIVFRDAFDGTGDRPAGCTEVCSVSEAPPSLKTLCFRPVSNNVATVYKDLFALPKSALACTDYEFGFKFAFPRDSAKAFTLTLVSGDSTNVKSRASTVVTISQKAMGIRPASKGLLPPFEGNDQDLDIRFFPNGVWHQALVRVQGTTIQLFVENDGQLRPFAQAETVPAPLLGFNLSGATAVDFDDIEIRRINPPAQGDFRDENGVKVANRAAEYKIDVPVDATCASASFRLGSYPGAAAIKLGYADGTERVIDVKTFASKYAKDVLRAVNELGTNGTLVATNRTVKDTVNLPDAGLSFKARGKDVRSSWGLTYNTRPKLQYRYEPDRELQVVANWESFPAASRKFVRFELRRDGNDAQLWLDGRYATRLDSTSAVRSLSFVLPANGAIRDAAVSSKPVDRRFLPLDVSQIANPGAMADAKLSLSGSQEIAGVPFLVVDGPGNADTGVCRENLGSFALECDGYLTRTPFEGMPESLLLSVPVAEYMKAWALCAVEDDPDKVSIITARLTKFLPGGDVGRGPAIADTVITLPRLGEPLPEGVKKVGEVKTGGKTLPLYLVEFKMDIGSIQEIIFQEKPAWLDFEVLGKCNDKDNFYYDRSRKPSDDISGVHVFAATLERAPVEMWIMPTVFGNYYRPGETAAMTATLFARGVATARLSWTVRDLHGRALEQGNRDVSFPAAGGSNTLTVAFGPKDLGWYSADFTLGDKQGAEWIRHTAYFAMIAPDTRKAGYESPYFAWNFGGAHGTIRDINVSGPLLLNAGVRNTHVASEDVGKPWKLTLGQLPRIASRSKDPQAAEREIETAITNAIAKYPHARMALIFHESGGGPYPLELLGGKTEVGEKLAAYDKAKAEHVALMAKAYRKLAPQIRLVVGNSGESLGLLASLFRAKVPREYIDFMGEESTGMTMPPEISVAGPFWRQKEVARAFGYGDIPVCACYEWKCRRARNLGLERYAEWNVRDILIAHAWKSPLIPTVALPDVTYSYNNTVWGDEAFTHNPQVYPKPSYPAVSTATLVLDCAKFERMLPTGSLTVYALEFKRDKEFIYAFWTARGEADATLDLEKDVTVRFTEMLGKSSELKSAGGKLKVRVGEGAVYLTSPVALKAVAALGERSFPREQPPAGAAVVVASKMDALADWKIDMSVDPRIDVPVKAPVRNESFRRPGVYQLSAVKDEQKGDCLELTLVKTNDCPALMQEYTFLKLAKPAELPGTPSTIGLWVKGNSSWGKVFWEIEDAEGERWLSAGTGGYGCDVYDWPERAGINFDGWNFLQFPITSKSPVKISCPGQDGWQWQHNGTGNRRIDYPIKVTGVAVSMPRQTLNLLEMAPVETTIRLAGLSAY